MKAWLGRNHLHQRLGEIPSYVQCAPQHPVGSFKSSSWGETFHFKPLSPAVLLRTKTKVLGRSPMTVKYVQHFSNVDILSINDG
jgi:hypothetical protein